MKKDYQIFINEMMFRIDTINVLKDYFLETEKFAERVDGNKGDVFSLIDSNQAETFNQLCFEAKSLSEFLEKGKEYYIRKDQ